MDAKLLALMQRVNQLGCLLPDPDSFDPEDGDELAQARLVLSEFQKAEAAFRARLRELQDGAKQHGQR